MRPILIIIGLVLGALGGGYLATTFGADYVANMQFESPDEQGSMYNMMFIGVAAVCALIGAVLGFVIAMVAVSDD